MVKSFTNPSSNYLVGVSNGTLSCNCMAFKMNPNKICKHMSYLLDQFNEHDDLKSYYHNIYIGITCFNSNHNSETYMMNSFTNSNQKYKISIKNNKVHCTCKAFEFNPDKHCKHIIELKNITTPIK